MNKNQKYQIFMDKMFKDNNYNSKKCKKVNFTQNL